MATYSVGQTSSFIREIQQKLKNAGYDPGPVDGVFGSRTESAVRAYQIANNLESSGVVGDAMLSSLGLATGGTTAPAEPGTNDYTDDVQTRFNGLAGQPEIWQNTTTGIAYIVHFVPDSDPPIPMLYQIETQEDLQSFFGDATIKFDKKVTTNDIASTGGTIWGTTSVLLDTEGDPFVGFVERMERAAKTQPWLEDPEVFAVFASAYLEDREPERWELEGTSWWQNHNDAQRNWMWAVARDPKEAERIKQDNYIIVVEELKKLGYDNADESMVQYLADQTSMGNWSTNYLNQQLQGLAGIDSAVPLDAGLQTFMSESNVGLGDSSYKQQTVLDMFNLWLGPAFPPSDQQVESWAAKLRFGGEAELEQLTEQLRAQRMALFPTYTNESLTYEDIAQPWRNVVSQVWGQTADETDPLFQKIVRQNDLGEAESMLRHEGLTRGISKVSQDAMTGILSTTGGSSIRRAL